MVSEIKLVEDLRTEKYYLIFKNMFRTNFNSYAVVPCRKVKLTDVEEMSEGSLTRLMGRLATSPFLLQREWAEVELNRRLFRLPFKRYVGPRNGRGYNIFTSEILVTKHLWMISGQ